MAQGTAGKRPTEFGGVPGLYGNVDQPGGVLAPWQERSAIMRTDTTNPNSQPSHGTGGKPAS